MLTCRFEIPYNIIKKKSRGMYSVITRWKLKLN